MQRQWPSSALRWKKLIPKTIGNRKRDCAWDCARGINTTWENLQIEKHKSVRWAERTPPDLCFSIWRSFQVVFIPRAQPHSQSLFLFPIVFGINLIHFFDEKKDGSAENLIACIANFSGLARKSANFFANFSATKVTSLPSHSLSLSLYLSLSPSAPHAHYRKRFRASYNIWQTMACVRWWTPPKFITVGQLPNITKKMSSSNGGRIFWQGWLRVRVRPDHG